MMDWWQGWQGRCIPEMCGTPLMRVLTSNRLSLKVKNIGNFLLLLLLLFFHLLIAKERFSSVQSLSRVRLFVTPWIAACQTSLSITNSWSLLKLMPIELVMPSSHLILPASGSFPMSQLFAWRGQSIGVSASTSVCPMNTQDWSPSRWTGWISLQSKGLSRIFSNTTV